MCTCVCLWSSPELAPPGPAPVGGTVTRAQDARTTAQIIEGEVEEANIKGEEILETPANDRRASGGMIQRMNCSIDPTDYTDSPAPAVYQPGIHLEPKAIPTA
jgi:hypothetical protein